MTRYASIEAAGLRGEETQAALRPYHYLISGTSQVASGNGKVRERIRAEESSGGTRRAARVSVPVVASLRGAPDEPRRVW
ncbi:MAG TPA: hypothetical protein PK867_24290, partial [Pirellulales bacterium]|nr:hypothetical protein [Pirellulales bacterium]